MSIGRYLSSAWRNLFRRKDRERDLDAELVSYVDLLVRDKINAGLSPADARRAALLETGGIDQVKENVRDVRAGALFDHALRDVRYALRALKRSPGFAAAAILALALGVGVTTSIFSVVYGVLLRPLPYPQPNELVRLWMSNPAQGFERDIVSYPQLLAWRERTRTVEHVVAERNVLRTLTENGEPEELRGQAVTEGFFEMMGVSPALGSIFTREQQSPDGAPAVVLSHSLWTTRFAADRALIGKTIQLNGAAVPVVGVMPAGFGDVQFWIPQQMQGGPNSIREAWGALWLPVYGRLRDGVTIEQAQADMSRVARELQAEVPQTRGYGVFIESLRDSVVGNSRTSLLLLLGAVVSVLLIACANIANLLLARGTTRRGELAVRAALGASRGALVRQVLLESVVLGLIGGVLGTAIAFAGTKALVSIADHSVPRLDAVQIDGAVLAFSLCVSLLASLLFGAAPALAAAREHPAAVIRSSGRSSVRGAAGVRPALIAGQFALALVLLYGAGLLLRSFSNLLNVDRGFSTQNVLAVRMNLPGQRYSTRAAVLEFYQRLVAEISSTPGVQSAGSISSVFLSELPQSASITVEGRKLSPADSALPVAYDAVTPNAFRTLGMRLLKGRNFTDGDDENTDNVAIVNEAFVKRFLNDVDPIDRRFAFGQANADSEYIRIVGVVRDAKRSGVDQPVMPSAFFPLRQYTPSGLEVLVRTQGDPLLVVPRVREIVRGIDPLQPLAKIRTLDSELSATIAPRRFVMLLLIVFATAATILAAIGIYGVIAYMVGRRTREFGLRMALGAQPLEVLALVMRQAGRYVAAGIAVGWAGSIAAARLLSNQLFGVQAFDTRIQLATVALLSGVALIAVWLPARRATGADPLIALRAE